MQTKDHYLLGEFLLNEQGIRLDSLRKKLFLLGCIEPDYNPLTYARGSVKYRFLHGHNAENARKHLEHLAEKLTASGVKTPYQWFCFGAALHYLADSFTFAHNSIFSGSLKEHRVYETLLDSCFVQYLNEKSGNTYRSVLPMSLEGYHKEYLSAPRSFKTDCRYIVNAALDLSASLRVCVDKPQLEHRIYMSPIKR